jgi:hypothetical protein
MEGNSKKYGKETEKHFGTYVDHFLMCVEIAGNFGCTLPSIFYFVPQHESELCGPSINLTRTLRYVSGFARYR